MRSSSHLASVRYSFFVAGHTYSKANISSYITNDLGGGQEDNIIVTKVNFLGELEFDLLGLNSDMLYNISELTDYTLPE